jgi:ribonuclease HI
VVSSYPLRVVLHNPNATGNIAKWVTELAEFELDFIPHHALKNQVLADFVVNWTPPPCYLGGQTTASWSLELRPSPGLIGFSSSTAPHESRGGAWVLLLTPIGE